MSNKHLRRARMAKNDEFYTLYEDIEKEVLHYRDKFRGKTVYCNCDNPNKSNFCKFFLRNFRLLHIKRLICTGYNQGGRGHILDTMNPDEVEIGELDGDGDFSSDECLELLGQADIVCTNPPFSLLRRYIGILASANKEFLIIGNINALVCKVMDILVTNGRMRLGYTTPKKFIAKSGDIVNMAFACWITTFKVNKPKLELVATYSPDRYEKYSNYPYAINVNRIKDIPCDYYGEIGVPLTFLHYHNEEQFSLVGTDSNVLYNCEDRNSLKFEIKDKNIYSRFVIRRNVCAEN